MLKSLVSKISLMLMLTGLLISHSFTFFFFVEASKSGNEALSLETDRAFYGLGENVTIKLTNIGNQTIEIGGYPAWQILTYPAEDPVYPKILAFLAWSLRPGENDTFVWNQFNEIAWNFCTVGTYAIRDTQGWNLSVIFKISFLGDVNGDFLVNMRDIAACCDAFNSTPGHPRWNSAADINNDSIVNMRDIAIIINNFGKHYT